MDQERFPIAQAAARVGRSTITLRRLEAKGTIPAPARDINGHRLYTAEEIEHIRSVIYPSQRAS